MIRPVDASAVETETRSESGWATRRLAGLVEENGLLVLVVCAAAFAFLVRLPHEIGSDGWMVLLSGREILQHGLPSHDSLTVWAHGRRWVDQQWLAQSVMYSLDRLGGIRLVMLAHAALSTGGFAAACAVARRRGASAMSVTWIGGLGLLVFYPEAVSMRAQSFAYLLYIGVLGLLLRDSAGEPGRRVYLVFPLLVLWANVHGSVVVGAGFVSVYGLLALRRSWRTGPARGLLLAVLPWACVLASPYARSLPSYYRWILFDAHFDRFVTEWQPTTLGLATAPVFVLAIGGAWLLGRARPTAGGFELLVLLGTAALAFQERRNFPWLGLAAVVILAPLLDRLRAPTPAPRRLNLLVAAAALAGAALTFAVVATRPDSWFLESYPAAAADAAASAAGTSGRIFANESYADWLVWNHPELAGRIAFDTRFELLTEAQLTAVLRFRTETGNWQAAAAGYPVLVLSATDEGGQIGALLKAHRAVRVADDAGIVVLRRNHSA